MSALVNPAKQINSVLGITTFFTYICIAAATANGGGGGGGGGYRPVPPGGGGGKAIADSQMTPSAKRAWHGRNSANMAP